MLERGFRRHVQVKLLPEFGGLQPQRFEVHHIGGRQYIAVTSGLGGGSPRMVPRTIIPDVHHPQTGNALYVFALPDSEPSRSNQDQRRQP